MTVELSQPATPHIVLAVLDITLDHRFLCTFVASAALLRLKSSISIISELHFKPQQDYLDIYIILSPAGNLAPTIRPSGPGYSR